MKVLVMLTMMVSAAAFAQPGGHNNEERVKCWDTAQGRRGYPTYVFEIEKKYPGMNPYLQLELKYPQYLQLERKHDCWVSKRMAPPANTTMDPRYTKFEVCLGEGQHINGLVPVDIDEENFEGTVYCEREIKQVFRHNRDESVHN